MRRRLVPAFAAAAGLSAALLWALPAGALTSTATGAPGPAAAVAPASGVTVTAVRYVLDAVDGAALAAVELDLATAPAPARLQVRLRAGGTWHACTATAGHAVCATPGETVGAVAGVELVSAS